MAQSTLEPCALPKFALPPEGQPLEKALRPKVARIGPGEHSVHLELGKRVPAAPPELPRSHTPDPDRPKRT